MRDLIRLRGANFRYRGSPRPVLKDVSLTVREGDRILIRGPSGSGKSTLLQILAGLAPEYVAGELSGHREILYLAKGVVLQNPEAQIVTPSVEEEVAFALENSGMETSEMRSRVSGVLEGLGLSRISGRHPLTLSGGECQRVSLAAALAVKPDILFLDEPTAYLDEGSTRRFFESLALLPERTAVVVVEHKIQAAATICETCYEVSGDGRLAQSDFRPGAALPHAAPSPRHPAPARSSPCVLEVQGLGHRFGKTGPILFSDVDLSLGRGETAALMGPSGCGKTTLLGKIAGILPSAPGVVRFDGRDSSALKEREFNAFFMYVPQNPEHMFVANSAAEELDLSGKNARELAAKFGLEARLRSSPFRLSEGEKRRLNMSVALAEERTFYLLDEPTYGLDDSTRALLVHDVRALAERGAAVLFVTHDTEFAKCVAEKIYWMEGGKISARGAGYADEVRSA